MEPFSALLWGSEFHVLRDADPIVRALTVDKSEQGLVLLRDPRSSPLGLRHDYDGRSRCGCRKRCDAPFPFQRKGDALPKGRRYIKGVEREWRMTKLGYRKRIEG